MLEDRLRQRVSGCKLPAAGTIRANKVGVTKLANRFESIRFATRPQIASRKSAKDGSATRLAALAL
jgi:hypothetical protein